LRIFGFWLIGQAMAALDCNPNFRGYGAGWSKIFFSYDNLGDQRMSKNIISNAAVVSYDYKAQCVLLVLKQ